MPTQNTKLTIGHPQATGWLLPQTPTPFHTWYASMTSSRMTSELEMPNARNHAGGVFFSEWSATISVTSLNERMPVTSGAPAWEYAVASGRWCAGDTLTDAASGHVSR